MTHQTRVLIVAITVAFVAFLDGAVINVALPAIRDDLGGGLAVQQWVVDGYLITLGAFILTAGSLSDSFGRLRIMRIGLYGFGVASIACALAQDGVQLIIARVVQGAAGALLVPSALALIIATFSKEEQGKAIGRWTAWTTAAFLAGPLLGGLLVDYADWRLVFAINILPIAAALVLMRKLGTDEATHRAKVDYVGAVLGILGLGGPVFGLIEQSRLGWDHPGVWLPIVLGVLAFAAFLWWENRVDEPMVPLGMFGIRNFGFCNRIFMTVGPLVIAAGWFWYLLVDERVDYLTQLLPGIVLVGLGTAITVAPLTSATLGAVEQARAGIGSAINNAVARIAGLVTVACTGLIVGSAIDLGGFHRAVLVTAILLVIGAAVSFVGIRRAATEAPT